METLQTTIAERQVFRAAKAAVVDSGGRLLILWRSALDEYRPGCADFPGGEIEDQESPLEAVVREVEEETSIVLSASGLYKVGRFTKHVDEPGNALKTVESTLFVGLVDDPEVHLGEQIEHHAFEWIPVKEVQQRRLLANSVSKMACLNAILRQQDCGQEWGWQR